MIDNPVLPDGVDEVEEWESEVLAVADHPNLTEENTAWDDDGLRPFNPQNGRWYGKDDLGCASFDSTTAVGALEVMCAYSDCNGRDSVMVEGDINNDCPECGEPQMGRGQFSLDKKNKRSRRSTINEAVMRNDFAKEMNNLNNMGVGTVPAIDYIMCTIGNTGYREWANARGVAEKTVEYNVRDVQKTIQNTS